MGCGYTSSSVGVRMGQLQQVLFFGGSLLFPHGVHEGRASIGSLTGNNYHARAWFTPLGPCISLNTLNEKLCV